MKEDSSKVEFTDLSADAPIYAPVPSTKNKVGRKYSRWRAVMENAPDGQAVVVKDLKTAMLIQQIYRGDRNGKMARTHLQSDGTYLVWLENRVAK